MENNSRLEMNDLKTCGIANELYMFLTPQFIVMLADVSCKYLLLFFILFLLELHLSATYVRMHRLFDANLSFISLCLGLDKIIFMGRSFVYEVKTPF